MRRLVLAPVARMDIAALLRESRKRFGPAALVRYLGLLDAAYADLQADPERLGVRRLAETEGLHLYPLRRSRSRLPAKGRVGSPRHVIIFSYDAAEVRILRVLHERMDVEGRLGGD